jgi:ankyrin repeat protein
MALRKKFRTLSHKKACSAAQLVDCVAAHDLRNLRRLLKEGAKREGTNARGETALIVATKLGDFEALEILIEAGALLDAKSHLGLTALMAAAQNGDMPALKVLIAKGADPNMQKNDGTTALMLAAMFGRAPAVELLAAKGANAFLRDIYGYTALMFAEDRKCRRALRKAEEAAGRHVKAGGHEDAADDRRQASLLRKALAQAAREGHKRGRASAIRRATHTETETRA